MIDISSLQLFTLQCAAIQHDLDATMRALRMRNERSGLEVETDILISEYISQIDFKDLSNAERMAEFYKLFFAVENDIRAFVEDTLQELFGTEWWQTCVPQSVRENVQRNVDREAAEGLPPRSARLIEYTTFGELNDIIKDNWESFSGTFSSVSRNRVLRVLTRLNHARGPIAHCNFLPEEEAVRLKLTIRDWYKLME